jgi:hypothetical protein
MTHIKKMKQAQIFVLSTLILPALFCSCIGVNADITINPDNSGTMVLEYRISRVLEALGKQDGNERWLPVPSGKADFERSLKRLPGMSLLSFSLKEDDRDIIVTVKLGFTNMDALVRFLDAYGDKAVFVRENALSRLTMILSEGGGGGDGDLKTLFFDAAKGYSLDFTLNVPSSGALKATRLPGGAVVESGKKLSCSMPLSEVLSSKEPVRLEWTW